MADAPAGVICWREALEEEVPAETNGTKRQFTKDDLIPHVPTDKVRSPRMHCAAKPTRPASP